MRINLYDVLSVTGKVVSTEIRLEEMQDDFQGEALKIVCKEPFTLNMKHPQKHILELDMCCELSVGRTCSRCLTDVVDDLKLKIHRTINMETKEAYDQDSSEADEISYIEDCTLDVDRLVLDELYTVIPMSVLCKEDCKGICKVCGTNLNKSTCDCDQTVPDPRMAVFSDIFNQFKEV